MGSRSRDRLVRSLSPVLFLSAISCGYRAVYASVASRLHVTLVRTLVVDAVASDEVAGGVREELARQGALAAGDGWPRVEIEVLRADETSAGIAARDASAGAPVARGLELAIVARAWVAAGPEAEPQADTGDLRAEETIAVDVGPSGALDPRASAFHRADALRAAARRLGRALARRLTGSAAASEEL